MSDELLNGDAVNRVALLAKASAGADLLSISVNGNGLPSSFPAIFDRREDGDGLKSLKALAEEWRLRPERLKGSANVTTLQSFIDLTVRHKTEHSAVFAATAWPNPMLTAVLNYHEIGNGHPNFGDHRIRYTFPITDEFKAWADGDSKPMPQDVFAAFIEEHAPELSDPTLEETKTYGELFRTAIASPTDLISLSRGLQINVAAQVTNNVTLQSGEGEITFVEEHRDRRGDKITVPGLFMIALPAFIDGEPVRIPVRLRYRVREGKIAWFYQLFRWKQLLRDRVTADLAKVKAETALPTFEGSPEA